MPNVTRPPRPPHAARAAPLLLGALLAGASASPADAQVVADFTATPATGTAALTVQFDDASTPASGTLQTWDFGDGTGASWWDPVHEYTEPGTYSVTLTVTEISTGLSDTVVKTDLVTVLPADLQVSFGAAPVAGSLPPQVAFTDTSTGGTPTAWQWDFGDGTTSTAAAPVHTYAWPGQHEVTLTAWVGSQAFVGAPTSVLTKAVFDAGTTAASAFQATLPRPGDVDGDGDQDLVCLQTTRAIWFENDGAGGLAPWAPLVTLTHPSYPTLAIADLDGDGTLDLATGGFDGATSQVTWFANDGQGTFGAATPVGTLAVPASDLRAADLDGDGDQDLLCVTGGWPTAHGVLGWFENVAGAGPVGPLEEVATFDPGPDRALAVDLDGDGDLDLVAALGEQAELRRFENVDGLGTFVPGGSQASAIGDALALHAADLDGDGDADVLQARTLSIEWFENTGGPLAPGAALATGSWGPATVRTADLDADGDVDVFAPFVAFLGNPTAAWWENLDGRGGFGGAVPLQHAASDAVDGLLTDVDGDGDADAWVVRSSGGVLRFVNGTQWAHLGGASTTTTTPPRLLAHGVLAAGSPLTLVLDDAPAGAPLLLWLSFAPTPADVLGGTLYAFPRSTQLFVIADGSGAWSQSLTWPAIAAGIPFWLQAVVQDDDVPASLTLSNGLRGTSQ